MEDVVERRAKQEAVRLLNMLIISERVSGSTITEPDRGRVNSLDHKRKNLLVNLLPRERPCIRMQIP